MDWRLLAHGQKPLTFEMYLHKLITDKQKAQSILTVGKT